MDPQPQDSVSHISRGKRGCSLCSQTENSPRGVLGLPEVPQGHCPDLGGESQVLRDTLCPHPVPLQGAPRVGLGARLLQSGHT